MTLRQMAVTVAVVSLAAGCTTAAEPVTSSAGLTDSKILAIGDSIFEFNSIQGGSIPDVIGEVLGTAVSNAAQAGAHFSNSDSGASAKGLDIRDQYVAGNWDWVILDGGGNDYLDDCGCGDCEPYIDDLVASDGLTGEMVDFITGLVSGETQVMIMGYYDVPSDAQFGFDQCGDEAKEHNRRLALLAAATESVWFISAGDVVSVDDRAAYAQDRVHPSLIGSKAIGEYLAAGIASIEDN